MGPRDGLQNEKAILETPFKIDFINQLSQTGLKRIEVTSFVSPKWVPQMADNKDVYTSINKDPSIVYSALVPNERGMDMAEAVDCQEIAVFTGASEGFVNKNINCSIVSKTSHPFRMKVLRGLSQLSKELFPKESLSEVMFPVLWDALTTEKLTQMMSTTSQTNF